MAKYSLWMEPDMQVNLPCLFCAISLEAVKVVLLSSCLYDWSLFALMTKRAYTSLCLNRFSTVKVMLSIFSSFVKVKRSSTVRGSTTITLFSGSLLPMQMTLPS